MQLSRERVKGWKQAGGRKEGRSGGKGKAGGGKQAEARRRSREVQTKELLRWGEVWLLED